MLRRATLVLAAVVLFACGSEPPGPLEIGLHDEVSDTFVPLADNDMMPVILGPNGLNMVVPSLRAQTTNPSAPSPTVTVTVGGILMAADLAGEPTDMVADGAGYVLFNLNVPFQTDLCCFNCSLGLVEAKLEDRCGRTFAGQVTVQLSRNATCPDPSVCCADANACPDPNLTQVCP